jgi:hypothetical protein
MEGKVLFTDNFEIELSHIRSLSEHFLKKIYVYGRGALNVDYFKNKLPEFVFVKLEDVLLPANIYIFIDNADSFFVLKCLRFSDIMNRNVEKLQLINGYKLVVDNHPFLGKSDICWGYFLWSFFDRSLLGYPHCYAFQTFLKKGLIDYPGLAMKVLDRTETTLEKIFDNDIVVQRYPVSQEIRSGYQLEKKKLFESEDSSKKIIKKLRRFLLDKCPELCDGFDLITFSKIFDQYQRGCRVLKLTDQKVDEYLENEFWTYVNGVNLFMGTLWKNQRV